MAKFSRKTVFHLLLSLVVGLSIASYTGIWNSYGKFEMTDFKGGRMPRLSTKTFSTKTLTTATSEFVRKRTVREFLEDEFNKTIVLEKVLQLRRRATMYGLSTSIQIPKHQRDKPVKKVTYFTGSASKQVNGSNTRLKKLKSKTISKKTYSSQYHSNRLKKTGELIPPQRTCAVIGNGGILLNSGCGAEIDAHDFVMRSNLAPIKEFVNDVGNETNVMTNNGFGSRRLLYCAKTGDKSCEGQFRVGRFREFPNAVIWFSKLTSVPTLDHRTYVNFFRRNNLYNLVAYPFKNLKGLLRRFWNMTDYPSSGLFLYTAAVPFCDMISLYGFYPFSTAPDGRTILYHYEGKTEVEFNNSHNMPSEYRKLTEMSKQGYFRMVTDKCAIS
ncbi:CMP-N-acetylneuraminate-poly-alpha-2,8-sialyltransferase-like [Antedon mediterranea]|uniref:CMP-N-acetylneuraminate-poly-alpha-2, 8-sialyltransferase-like n=1 Tax=Antedon mediterranea TaxID=105859 RepID=UPI003AF54319